MKILPGSSRTWIDLSPSGPFIDEANLNDFEAKFRAVDALLQAGATERRISPPGSPADGSVYLVDVGAMSGWLNQDNKIARYNGATSTWEFFAPAAGWWISIGAQDYRFSGTAWVAGWVPNHAAEHEYGGSQPITGQNLPGLRVSDSPAWAQVAIRAASTVAPLPFQTPAGSRRFEVRWDEGNDRWALFSGNDDGTQRSNRILVPRSDSSPVWVGLGLNIASGSGQLAGVDFVTSSREGRFTGMRLSNMSSGQIPVASDGNGQITASGLTDDGTFLGISRTIRVWNSLARSGNTWTDFQWTQDPNERVSIFGANVAGADGFHSIVLAPYDTETTGRFLGIIHWGQRGSGRSGTAPGLKAEMLAESIGAGGAVGGLGARMRLRYRPDNGANLVDALRVGAFGGSTVDAVESAILLRAAAGAKVAGDFVLDSTPAAGATAGDILQRDLNGRLTKATPNVFYLSAYFPESTGTSTVDITKHRSAPHSGSWTLDDFTVKFHRQTGTGTLSLPAASATYDGREYKITFHGRFNFTVSVASGSIYSLAAGASYWYNVASSTVSAGDASGDNCSCDLWCDGSNWYIRW